MKKLFLMLMLFAPMAMFAQKFGHVNAQEVMASMPEFLKAKGEIEASAKKFENELTAMQSELKRKSDEYEKSKNTMNHQTTGNGGQLAANVPENSANLSRQPTGFAEGTAREDGPHHR